MREYPKGTIVLTRAGQPPEQIGRTTGGTRRCQMEGCLGIRLGVRWPDGSLTYPCTRGLESAGEGKWRIA